VVSVTDSYGLILGFLDKGRDFCIKQLLSCTHEAEATSPILCKIITISYKRNSSCGHVVGKKRFYSLQ
jgi:hypothetical protein